MDMGEAVSDVVRFTRRPPSRHPAGKAAATPTGPADPPVLQASSLAGESAPAVNAPRRRRAPTPAPAVPPSSTVVAWVRLLPEQAERLAELAFVGNRELEDQARAAGTYRLKAQDRLTESDVIRYAIDQLLAQGGWEEHRRGLRKVIGQTRKPGRPARGGKR